MIGSGVSGGPSTAWDEFSQARARFFASLERQSVIAGFERAVAGDPVSQSPSSAHDLPPARESRPSARRLVGPLVHRHAPPH